MESAAALRSAPAALSPLAYLEPRRLLAQARAHELLGTRNDPLIQVHVAHARKSAHGRKRNASAAVRRSPAVVMRFLTADLAATTDDQHAKSRGAAIRCSFDVLGSHDFGARSENALKDV